jgi:hypothetical protein
MATAIVPAAADLGAAGLSTGWHVGTQRRRLALLTVGAVLASLSAGVLVLLFTFIPALVLTIWAVVIVATAWPLFGLCALFGLVSTFEAGSADLLMRPGMYYYGSLQSALGLTGMIASPLELLLLLCTGSWLFQGIAGRRLRFRGGALGWPVLAFSLALLYGIVWGALTGGDLNVALWESRFLIYMVFCYVLATNLVRTTGHVRTLTGIMLVGIGLSAVEGAYRKLALINTGKLGVIPEFAYGHEVVIFLGAWLLLVLAQHIFGAPAWQRWFGTLLLPVVGFTLLATERRAGYIAIAVALLAFAIVVLRTRRKVFFLVFVPLLICASIYLPLFWRSTGLLGQPARAVRSLSDPDPRDAQSDAYRDLEKIDVRITIDQHPLTGIGFGREFSFAVPLPDLSWWPFWHFEPHLNVMWIWLKLGALGFVAFWTLMGSAIMQAAYTVKNSRVPEARTFALVALGTIIMCLVFSYVDLGLVNARLTVLMGVAMGTLAVLRDLPSRPAGELHEMGEAQ